MTYRIAWLGLLMAAVILGITQGSQTAWTIWGACLVTAAAATVVGTAVTRRR